MSKAKLRSVVYSYYNLQQLLDKKLLVEVSRAWKQCHYKHRNRKIRADRGSAWFPRQKFNIEVFDECL